ncbi:hypothetical protein GTZ78_45245 [Streptomyces sp. SID8361]|nr:hypothetical protein [Streptomyces sp. SID8361]
MTRDVLRPIWGERMNGVMSNRLAPFTSCLIALAIAQSVSDIVGIVTVAADLLAAALFVPVMGALFARRSGTRAAVASIVTGAAACIVCTVVFGLYANQPVMFGMVASLLVFVLVSLLTERRPPVDFEELAPPLGRLDDSEEPQLDRVH